MRLAFLQGLANHPCVALVALHAVVHIEVAEALLRGQAQLVQAQQIIGSGEQWLTELSTTQLRDLLTLRRSTMEDES